MYALPGAMHSAFAQFHAFSQDAIDNRALTGPKLHIPAVREIYEAQAKPLSSAAAGACMAGDYDEALALLRQAFLVAPHKVDDWRYYAGRVEAQRTGA